MNKLLERIRKALDNATCPKDSIPGKVRNGNEYIDCPACMGTGLDPAYDALRRMVEDNCARQAPYFPEPCLCTLTHCVHCACNGTGKVPRDISQLRPGELQGGLVYAIQGSPLMTIVNEGNWQGIWTDLKYFLQRLAEVLEEAKE